MLGTNNLLTEKMQNKDHFGLEVIRMVDDVNAFKYLLFGFLVLLGARLLEYLKELFGLSIFRVGKEELDCVTKEV